MNIYDQLKQLWARVTGLEKSGAATDTKIAALEAAAVRIPKDYSTTETDTGVKWFDGKNIYQKSFSGITPDSETNYIDLEINAEKLINIIGSVISANNIQSPFIHQMGSYLSGGNLRVPKAGSVSYQNTPFEITVFYTKTLPTTETKKATKKKTTKNKED